MKYPVPLLLLMVFPAVQGCNGHDSRSSREGTSTDETQVLTTQAVEAAKRVNKSLHERLEAGEPLIITFIETLCLWSERQAHAEHDASDDPQGKRAALEAHIARLQELETMVLQIHDANPAAASTVRYFLLRAKSKANRTRVPA